MRKGFIGARQIGFLHGFRDAAKIAGKTLDQDTADLARITLVTAYQAGFDQFIVTPTTHEHPLDLSFLKTRVKVASTTIILAHLRTIDTAFNQFLPDDWVVKEDFKYAHVCRMFLLDLFVSMSTNATPLSMEGLPSSEDIMKHLPLELASPLSNLLAAMKQISASCVVPRHEIMADDVRRFKDIVSSDLFKEYARSQSELDNGEVSLEGALPAVAKTAMAFATDNARLVAFRKTAAGVLQFTPKVIDIVAGKLPGMLAEALAKLGLDLIESRRRVIFYDFRPSLRAALGHEIDRMLQSRAMTKDEGSETSI